MTLWDWIVWLNLLMIFISGNMAISVLPRTKGSDWYQNTVQSPRDPLEPYMVILLMAVIWPVTLLAIVLDYVNGRI